jgi:hypothetical protein
MSEHKLQGELNLQRSTHRTGNCAGREIGNAEGLLGGSGRSLSDDGGDRSPQRRLITRVEDSEASDDQVLFDSGKNRFYD